MPSAFSLFGASWKAVTVNLLTIVEFVMIPLLVNLLVMLIFRKPGDASLSDLYILQPEQLNLGTSYYAGSAISLLVTLLLLPAGTLVYLNSVKGKKIDFVSAIKQSLRFWFKFIGISTVSALALIVGIVSIFYGFSVVLGLVLFIVPGIFIYQRLLLAGYFMIDKRLGVAESIKTSWRTTKRYSNSVWGVLGVTVAISIVPSLLVRVIPLATLLGQFALLAYSCAPAIRYMQIQKSIKDLA